MPSRNIFRPWSLLMMELLRLMSVRRVDLRCTLAAQFDPIYFDEENEKEKKGKNAAQKKAVTNYLIAVWLRWKTGKEDEMEKVI